MRKKWVRRHWVIVFPLILAAGLAFIYLYSDHLLKNMIEKQGTEAVGAKVELAEAKLSFFPFGVSLSGLQVTNPDQPMKNAVEIDRIAFSLDLPELFFHKIIIDEMTIREIRLDTDRATSGAIIEQESASRKSDDKKTPSKPVLPTIGNIPNVKEILANEELESLKLARQIEHEINTIKNRWLARLSELADQKKIKNYEQRIKKSGKGNWLDILDKVVNNADELTSLYQDLNRDYKRIKSAGKDFNKDFKRLQERIKQVEELSQKDIRRLKEKYLISPQGNVSEMLFGEEVGRKVETEPLPEFLVRRVRIYDFQTGIGSFTGTIRNLTSLNRILKDAFAVLVNDRLKSLDSEIMKKAGKALAELNSELVGFKSLEADLTKRLQKLVTMR